VFSIPCPLPIDQLRSVKSSGTLGALHAVSVLSSGQIVLAYEGYGGLTMMNFNIEDPPDRPPTRCQRRLVM
jgi:hypothetical protein